MADRDCLASVFRQGRVDLQIRGNDAISRVNREGLQDFHVSAYAVSHSALGSTTCAGRSRGARATKERDCQKQRYYPQKKAVSCGLRVSLLGECCYVAFATLGNNRSQRYRPCLLPPPPPP